MSRQQRLLQRDLSSEEGVEIASGVMVERKMSLEKGYRRALSKAFQAHPHQVDFTKPDQAVGIINSWVSDHTAGTHTNQLTACHLQRHTQLCLKGGACFASIFWNLCDLFFVFSSVGAIPEFLASGSLTDETRLVLLNALNFQGQWKIPFDPKLTQERMFHCANGSTVPVHMMRLISRFNYGRLNTLTQCRSHFDAGWQKVYAS